MTLRYPAIFAWELKTSYDWARDNIRGTQSNANMFVFWDVNVLYNSVLMAGEIIPTSVLPASLDISSDSGGRIFVTMSEVE